MPLRAPRFRGEDPEPPGTCTLDPDGPCGPGERCDEAARACVRCGLPGAPACPVDLDAGVRDAGVRDGGRRGDIGPADAVGCDAVVSGAACTWASACPALDCNLSSVIEVPSIRPDRTRGRSSWVEALPGGYCARTCDATRLNDECAPCGVCRFDALAGNLRVALYDGTVSGVCREACTPTRDGTGCPRAGYTCDLETFACMEACTTDEQCQIISVHRERRGGIVEYLDRGESFPSFCDRATGRCRTAGTPGARIGDVCEADDDCEDDGACIRFAGDAAGVCSRRGCLAPGFECPAGTACDVRNAETWASGCFVTCEVGADDGTAGMTGSGGGHPSCGPGRACVWNGLSEPGEPNGGSCVLGEYNDVPAPNVGAPCRADSECYSPFGLGTCLYLDYPGVTAGLCSVTSCATFLRADGTMTDGLLPGVEIDRPICDPARSELCMNFERADEPPGTQCLAMCDSPADCAAEHACAELLAGRSFCWPWCVDDGECRSGSACLGPLGTACEATDRYCTCAPRSP